MFLKFPTVHCQSSVTLSVSVSWPLIGQIMKYWPLIG